jgi:hypothetical protein
VHGHGSYIFVVDETVAGGSNLICEILRLILNDLEAKNKLPCDNPVLYLQVDNCGENKNKYMFAFLTELVRKKVFAKIKACFLMVGHTHEDIDQFFSTISNYLKQIHIVCPDQLSFFNAIRQAFQAETEKPIVIELNATSIPDYKHFYEKRIDPKIAHYQEPHQFRFKCFNEGTKDEVILVHYKNWAESTQWLPRANEEAADKDQPAKKTKHRGQVTRGQQADKIRADISATKLPVVQTPLTLHLEQLEIVDASHEFEDLQACSAEYELSNAAPIQGILWLTSSHELVCFPLTHFPDDKILQNYQLAMKIHSDILRIRNQKQTTIH